MSGDLDRAKILDAFEMLSLHLRHKGIRAHIYVFGGAAMVLTDRRSRTTAYIDAWIVDATGSVIQAAREIAAKLGLPRNWLNDDIRTLSIMPPPHDTRAAIVFRFSKPCGNGGFGNSPPRYDGPCQPSQ